MSETKSKQMFRNAGTRIFYLKPREGQKGDFMFGPGMTIEPLNDQEALMLATISTDIRDVAKDAPVVGSVISDLQSKVADERKLNAELRAENEMLKAQAQKVNKTADVAKEVAPAARGRKRQ